jgi:hypothetical protein
MAGAIEKEKGCGIKILSCGMVSVSRLIIKTSHSLSVNREGEVSTGVFVSPLRKRRGEYKR